MRAAEAIADSIRSIRENRSVAPVINVADYMSRVASFTHVTAYLWLLKIAPRVWDRIDRYQKKQTHTSPEWYYRSGCRRLFELVRQLQPRALVATEVGCCEIAALIKRDLGLTVPLVAVNVNYDVDRAWIQPEVDLYSVANNQVQGELRKLGAPPDKIIAYGVPMSAEFSKPSDREIARTRVCCWLELNRQAPIVLVSGGSEGIGQIEEITKKLTHLDLVTPQIIVLAGKNQKLHNSLTNLGSKYVRILGWTDRIADLMRAADLLVSKLGNTFDEAMAAELPIVALEPPPGSERVQYKLLSQWRVGRPVGTLGEMADVVKSLLLNRSELEAMRKRARDRRLTGAADGIAQWLIARCEWVPQTEAFKKELALSAS